MGAAAAPVSQCPGASYHRILLPREGRCNGDVGELWRRGDATVIVLGLVVSRAAGAVWELEFTKVCLPPAPAPAKLHCQGCFSGSCPTCETAKVGRRCTMRFREPGLSQVHHLSSSSLRSPSLGKLMVFDSLL